MKNTNVPFVTHINEIEKFSEKEFKKYGNYLPKGDTETELDPVNVVYKNKSCQIAITRTFFNPNSDHSLYSNFRSMTRIVITIPYNPDMKSNKEIIVKKFEKAFKILGLLNEGVGVGYDEESIINI